MLGEKVSVFSILYFTHDKRILVKKEMAVALHVFPSDVNRELDNLIDGCYQKIPSHALNKTTQPRSPGFSYKFTR